MTTPLPKWVMSRYSILWNNFKDSEFNHECAFKTLKEDKMTSVILSELRRTGWLEIKLDPKDARKRIYRLKNPEQAINEMEKS